MILNEATNNEAKAVLYKLKTHRYDFLAGFIAHDNLLFT